jgi:hypothetical protein
LWADVNRNRQLARHVYRLVSGIIEHEIGEKKSRHINESQEDKKENGKSYRRFNQ